ncbi:hypothetical protein C1645_838318, partial [Glomus cerebriforme]
MAELNKDVLFLILNEFQDDYKSLYSCLLINRTWCKITVPILWKMPERYRPIKLFHVLLLLLPEESRNILKNKGIDLFKVETYQQPLFNYISFWKYLNLNNLEEIIIKNIGEIDVSIIIRNEILKLLINNTKLIRLSIQKEFNYQIHLISGAERCFSDLEYLHCNDTNQNILEGLSRISKSIKKLTFDITSPYDKKNNNNFGIVKLIKNQKNLTDVIFNSLQLLSDRLHFNTLEESLIEKANNIHYLRIEWKPVTNILSYCTNLT